MLFNSIDFLLFLPVVLGLHWALPRARRWILLVASYVFYGFWDASFLGLIMLSTAIDYLVGRALMGTEDAGKRKVWLLASILANLSILTLFKYANFFIAEARTFFGLEGDWALDMILPVGISFYTFQTLGYTLDVYRRRIPAERNLLTFAVFVAFFPQLMAGPIERARDLLPQLRNPGRSDLSGGFRLFLLGLVKKTFISTTLAAHCDLLYLNPALRSPGEAWWMGLLMFMHILMDFSGYSDMALGLGRMFGIRLSPNFNNVLASRSFPDFWRRWHMTLGRWFRDYVLLPLHRAGVPRPAAYLLTFSLIGFWHGASWNFIIWGTLMGVLWLLDSWRTRSRTPSPSPSPSPSQFPSPFPTQFQFPFQLSTLLSFIFIGQFFPTSTPSDALALMSSMVGWGPDAPLPFVPVPMAVWLALSLGFLLEWAVPRWAVWSEAQPVATLWIQSLILVPAGLALAMESLNVAREFVYFQF